MLKLFCVSSFALVVAASLSSQADAGGRRCAVCNPCTPSAVATQAAMPTPDAQASAPAVTGTRSMSVAPSAAPAPQYYAPARYYSYSSRTPSYLLPKSSLRRFNGL